MPGGQGQENAVLLREQPERKPDCRVRHVDQLETARSAALVAIRHRQDIALGQLATFQSEEYAGCLAHAQPGREHAGDRIVVDLDLHGRVRHLERNEVVGLGVPGLEFLGSEVKVVGQDQSAAGQDIGVADGVDLLELHIGVDAERPLGPGDHRPAKPGVRLQRGQCADEPVHGDKGIVPLPVAAPRKVRPIERGHQCREVRVIVGPRQSGGVHPVVEHIASVAVVVVAGWGPGDIRLQLFHRLTRCDGHVVARCRGLGLSSGVGKSQAQRQA